MRNLPRRRRATCSAAKGLWRARAGRAAARLRPWHAIEVLQLDPQHHCPQPRPWPCPATSSHTSRTFSDTSADKKRESSTRAPISVKPVRELPYWRVVRRARWRRPLGCFAAQHAEEIAAARAALRAAPAIP